MGWGPNDFRPDTGESLPGRFWVAIGLVGLVVWWQASRSLIGFGVMLVADVVALFIGQILWSSYWESRSPTYTTIASGDPGRAVLEQSRMWGGGAFLGIDKRERWRYSQPERAVLLLGPPRSGKTSAVIVPTVLGHDGPVVATSTKPDVLRATATARSRWGQVWRFDPTDADGHGPGEVLRWSPVPCSRVWDGALLMARAMVSGARVGAGTTDQTHWAKRAQGLLAPMLHAAAISGRDIAHVVDWVIRHELDEPGLILENGSPLAMAMLVGVLNTEGREQSSIFSAASDALDAYTSDAALTAARDPNFDPDHFVAGTDSIYIHAPAERQAAAAPLVCGLLAEIRRATYQAVAQLRHRRVLFALDEAANIAPMPELPGMASEGGSQGLVLIAAFQDLSQARARWGEAADGFLTLFGSKLILPGVADPRTLEAISLVLGEYDRTMTATTRNPRMPGAGPFASRTSTTTSTTRQRVLSPGEIAKIPAGHGLYLEGVQWMPLKLQHSYQDEPWRTLTQQPAAALAVPPPR